MGSPCPLVASSFFPSFLRLSISWSLFFHHGLLSECSIPFPSYRGSGIVSFSFCLWITSILVLVGYKTNLRKCGAWHHRSVPKKKWARQFTAIIKMFLASLSHIIYWRKRMRKISSSGQKCFMVEGIFKGHRMEIFRVTVINSIQ